MPRPLHTLDQASRFVALARDIREVANMAAAAAPRVAEIA
jgi:hypothetical protein